MSKRKVDPCAVEGDVADATGSEDAAVALPVKKRRTTQGGNLTNAQKRALCVRFASHKSTQQELCAWARVEFNLPHLPHQSTISKILARAGELTSMAAKDLAARRRGFVTHPELDTALCNWVLFARQSGAKLSGDMIKEKARQLAQRFGLASKMTFSNGWLGGFKKRHNIRLGGGPTTAVATTTAMTTPTSTLDVGLGSSADAVLNALSGAAALDAAAAAAAFAHSNASVPFAVRELQECVKLYAPADVFTMSETGLFYALSPEKSAGRGPRAASPAGTVLSSKKETERFTVLLAANADGSERLEPFVIGSAKLPAHALQSAASDDASLAQYRDNRKAWVTPVLFQEYVGLLDSRLRDQQRSILLLIAHAPSHIPIGLELTNIRLETVPPSTTRQFQPFEAGIFDAFKRRYRRHHLHHALDRFAVGQHDDLFHVDAAQAVRWVRECWFAVPSAVVKHYWDATEILTGAVPKPSPQEHHAVAALELVIDNEIVDAVTALHVARPLTIDEFVNPSDESVSLHCTGTDELDFILSVSDGGSSGTFAFGASALQASSGLDGTDALDRDAVDMDADLAVHAGTGVAGLGVGTTASVGAHAATSEQLLESLKVLLPELDRLRFDEHTKSSIRTAFRRLKDRESDHAVDTKQRQSATRRAMMVPSQLNSHSGSGASSSALALSLAAAPAIVPTSAATVVASDHHHLFSGAAGAVGDAVLEHSVI